VSLSEQTMEVFPRSGTSGVLVPSGQVDCSAKAPRISILISNYNHGRFLQQCFAGIFRQKFADFEIIVTDDGSTDGSQALLEQFAKKDSRVRLSFFQKNRGAMAATENNMARARGALIYGGAADDFIIDDRFFERAVNALDKHPQAAGFYGVAGLFSDDQGKLVGSLGTAPHEGYVAPADFYRAFVRRQVFVPGNSSIWRRDAMDTVGGFDYSLGPQVDFWVNHALPSKYGVVFAKVPVTCQRVYSNHSSFGAKATLWEIASRFARVEERLRAFVPDYDGMENDWTQWRMGYLIDAIEHSGLKAELADLVRIAKR
jgi:glycosyltransferase involved in cell wall biosynthesis